MRDSLKPKVKAYLMNSIGQIEIYREGAVEMLYFIIPPICHFLSEETKEVMRIRLHRGESDDLTL